MSEVVEHPAHVVEHGQEEALEHGQSHVLPPMEHQPQEEQELPFRMDGGPGEKPYPDLERFAEVYNSFKQDCKYDCRQKTAETFNLTPEITRSLIRKLNSKQNSVKKPKGRPNTVGEDRTKSLFETLRMQLDSGVVFKSEELREIVLQMTEKDIRKKADGQWFSRKAKQYGVPIRKTGGKPNSKPRIKKGKKEEETMEEYQLEQGMAGQGVEEQESQVHPESQQEVHDPQASQQ